MKRELSLFSGCGGGLLGTRLLGWELCGCVEVDEYCQRVLAQRMKEGNIGNCPIFGDIRSFIGEGYAEGYRGMVDVVTAGFPCQPFSVAGKRRGEEDERNLWPDTMQVIRLVRPRYAFLENVPGLLNSGYFSTILGDLAESGYDARWRVLSAAEVGAPHKRDRLWILAANTCKGTKSQETNRREINRRQGEAMGHVFGTVCQDVANTKRMGRDAGPRQGIQPEEQEAERQDAEHFCQDVADTNGTGRQQQCRSVADAPKHGAAECGSWWSAEPDVGRVAHGVPSRVDRLKALGNGQVPAVVATVWRLLNESEEETPLPKGGGAFEEEP